jgi:hypothetical protein
MPPAFIAGSESRCRKRKNRPKAVLNRKGGRQPGACGHRVTTALARHAAGQVAYGPYMRHLSVNFKPTRGHPCLVVGVSFFVWTRHLCLKVVAYGSLVSSPRFDAAALYH